MNTLIPSNFTFNKSSEIRTVLINKEVWFVAKDVFETLSLSWNGLKTLSIIPEAWRLVVKLTTKLKNQHGSFAERTNDTHVINFKAVCKIAFRSNKPEADNFTNWAAEVIEQVLKTGQYKSPVPTQKIDYLTDADMINLKRLVWHCAKLGFQEETITKAIWYCFRQVTNTPSPNKFSVNDLPELANEFQRIYNVLSRYKKICLNAENLVIKQLLRARSADETIFQDIVQSFDTADLNFNNELNKQLKLNFHAKDFMNRKLI